MMTADKQTFREIIPISEEGFDQQINIVKSGNVKTVMYSTKTKICRIYFQRGNGYNYYNVDKKAFEGFTTHESAGTYFQTQFVNTYECEKVE